MLADLKAIGDHLSSAEVRPGPSGVPSASSSTVLQAIGSSHGLFVDPLEFTGRTL